MRIAFFGGTFDPVHRGHLGVARAAAAELRLDRVLFAPVGRQPLKVKTAEAPFADRVAMAQLACAASDDVPKPEVSEIDAPRPDGRPNYTVDTLTELAQLFPGSELFAISGADSFLTLRSWRQPELLLRLAQWIVVSRPGFDLTQLASLALTAEQSARVHLLRDVHQEVSASELRRRLRAGDDCADWVPEPVVNYIRVRRLYGSPA
jgi:nicotinate-nucleotide adenylyltransferase